MKIFWNTDLFFFYAAQLPTNVLYLHMVCALTFKGTLVEKMVGQLEKDSEITLGFMCPTNCAPIGCKLVEKVVENRGT